MYLSPIQHQYYDKISSVRELPVRVTYRCRRLVVFAMLQIGVDPDSYEYEQYDAEPNGPKNCIPELESMNGFNTAPNE